MPWAKGTVPGRHPDIKLGSFRAESRHQYSPGIVLMNVEGGKIRFAKGMSGEKTREFYGRMTRALDYVKALPTGAKLLQEIDASGRVLRVIRGADGDANGSCVIPYPGDMKSSEERFVKQFRPPPKNRHDAMVAEGMWIKPRQAYQSELTRLLDRAQRKNARYTRDFVASLIGVPPRWLAEMEQGTRPIQDNEYYKLCLYLYDCLQPGAGSDAEMRVVFTQEKLPDEPIEIIVGHELIHAWRIMTGRRVFANGWEEEAMTTGLPPFSAMPYTENRLRLEAGLSVRSGYGTICSTSLLNAVRDLHTQPAREDRPFAERDIVGKAGKPLNQ